MNDTPNDILLLSIGGTPSWSLNAGGRYLRGLLPVGETNRVSRPSLQRCNSGGRSVGVGCLHASGEDRFAAAVCPSRPSSRFAFFCVFSGPSSYKPAKACHLFAGGLGFSPFCRPHLPVRRSLDGPVSRCSIPVTPSFYSYCQRVRGRFFQSFLCV